MTDDLVKRLNEDFSVNAREDIQHQMKVYETERKEAADRIEKLEAALANIRGWFPRNISNPHEQIRMIQDYAYAALKEKK
jgi:hypothetical protein